jgi:AbrB family looped-hinge helix DNA binding protein
MTTVISSKGQIVLPVEIRRQDDVRAGEEFEIERLDCGEYRLTRRTRRKNVGLVDLLLSCPAEGGLRPIERRETTDDIALPGAG